MKTLPCIPYINLILQNRRIKDEILSAVEGVLDSGHFILGSEVKEFETKLAEMCGVQEVVSLNSGTDALIMSLKLLGIGPGDEVITTPNTFIATVSAIEIVGATTVFVDVGEDYNLDPTQLSQALTAKTKAIIPVHLTGRMADMDPICKFAEENGLYIIEDAAQAVLSRYRGKYAGTFGQIGCFSFHPLKNLNACGDGGALVTNDPEIASEARLLRNLGLESRESCAVFSSSSRLDSIQAAILLVKLNYLDECIENRRRNAQFYEESFSNIEQLAFPVDRSFERSTYHTFVVQAENRDQLKSYLEEKGIGTAVHYPRPLHTQAVFKGKEFKKLPVTERQSQKILSLPIHQDLTVEELKYIVQSVREFYQG